VARFRGCSSSGWEVLQQLLGIARNTAGHSSNSASGPGKAFTETFLGTLRDSPSRGQVQPRSGRPVKGYKAVTTRTSGKGHSLLDKSGSMNQAHVKAGVALSAGGIPARRRCLSESTSATAPLIFYGSVINCPIDCLYGTGAHAQASRCQRMPDVCRPHCGSGRKADRAVAVGFQKVGHPGRLAFRSDCFAPGSVCRLALVQTVEMARPAARRLG